MVVLQSHLLFSVGGGRPNQALGTWRAHPQTASQVTSASVSVLEQGSTLIRGSGWPKVRASSEINESSYGIRCRRAIPKSVSVNEQSGLGITRTLETWRKLEKETAFSETSDKRHSVKPT
jgi:hypothetical protein